MRSRDGEISLRGHWIYIQQFEGYKHDLPSHFALRELCLTLHCKDSALCDVYTLRKVVFNWGLFRSPHPTPGTFFSAMTGRSVLMT